MITIAITAIIREMAKKMSDAEKRKEGGRGREVNIYSLQNQMLLQGGFYFLFSSAHTNTITLKHNGNPKANFHPEKTK